MVGCRERHRTRPAGRRKNPIKLTSDVADIMRTPLFTWLQAAALGGVICSAPIVEAADQIKVSDVLPAHYFRSIHYDIQDFAVLDNNFYRFRVDSDHGSFEVSSIAMLTVRLHELLALAQLKPVLADNGFSLDRAPEGKRGVGSDSVADIISDPLGTAGKLMNNFRHNFEATFTNSGHKLNRTPRFL